MEKSTLTILNKKNFILFFILYKRLIRFYTRVSDKFTDTY